MSHPTTYKPSPLSFGSPRTSPFRRPDSPASPLRHADSPSTTTTTLRPSTPTKSLSTPTIPQTSPSKTLETTTTTTPKPSTSTSSPWTPRGLPPPQTTRPIPPSPTRTSSTLTAIQSSTTRPHHQPLPTLSTPHLPALHQTFTLLDHDADGLITPSDISQTLTTLSLPTDLSPFFPPGTPQTLSLPTFLSTFSHLLAPLSSQVELLNAFSAFDERDSGEIDVGELRDAVMQTAPEEGGRVLGGREVDEVLGGFVGRRAFGKGNPTGGRGEVFRYREWVGGVMGVGEEGKKDEGGK